MTTANSDGALPMALPVSLTATRNSNIAILRLSRPLKRNALNDEIAIGLQDFFLQLPADIRAVVLHGEGPCFSTGFNLSESVHTAGTHQNIAHSQMWDRAFQDLQFGPVPVVSVLHGAVVGGALELAAATHIRIAERSAYYGLPEGQCGLFLGGGLVRITRLIGIARVQDMMLTGRTLSAEEGQAAGITQYLIGHGQGLAKAIDLAAKIATNVP